MEELDYDLAELFGIKLDLNDRMSLQLYSNKKKTQANMQQNQIYIPTMYPIDKSHPIINLIHNVYSGNKYKKILLEIEMTKKKGKQDVELINDIMNKLVPYGTAEETFFVAKDIFIIIGRKIESTTFIHYHDYEVVWANTPDHKKIIPMLTWKGIVRAGFETRNKALGEFIRQFAYNCIEVVLKTEDISHKIISKIDMENPELISKIQIELKQDIERYQKQIEYEKSKQILLKDELEKTEFEKLNIIQEHNNTKCKMEDIKQLYLNKREELGLYRNQLATAIDGHLSDNIINELHVLRRMVCKPVYIYALSSSAITNYLDKYNKSKSKLITKTKSEKKNYSDNNFCLEANDLYNEDSYNLQKYMSYIELVQDVYISEKYRLYEEAYLAYGNKLPKKIINELMIWKKMEDNSSSLIHQNDAIPKEFSKKSKCIKEQYLIPITDSEKCIYINPMKYSFYDHEPAYLYLHFSKQNTEMYSSNETFYYVCTEWVFDANHYNALIKQLKGIPLPEYSMKINNADRSIWYTSIAEIRNIIQLDFLNMYNNADIYSDPNAEFLTKSKWTQKL